MPPSALLPALLAIFLWSFLALLGTGLTNVPPILVVGLAMSIGGSVSLPWVRRWRVPWRTFLVGVGGIFGYHLLYFNAYHYAPAVEANLINYLWPLLIVALSPVVLRGSALGAHHLVGTALGMVGAALIATGGQVRFNPGHLTGYLLMAGAALTWALYSLLTKRLPAFPSHAVGGFCLASGGLSLLVALSDPSGLEHIRALTKSEWLLILLGGLGPMGPAFYAWDAALKRGDPRVIGALSYLTPFSSTLVLVFVAGKELTPLAGLATLLIVAGSLVGSRDLWRAGRPRTQSPN